MTAESSLPHVPINTNSRLDADQLWAMPVQERLIKLNWLGNMSRSDSGTPFLAETSSVASVAAWRWSMCARRRS